MIHLYTGEGKGKTTAAIGMCVRAAGRGFRVCFAQFMKGNDTGELYVLKNLPGVTVLRSEKKFGFYSTLSAQDKAELTDIHNHILDELLNAVNEGVYDMVILDEVTYPVKWRLLDKEKIRWLMNAGKGGEGGGIELVLTGRGAEDFMKVRADYITEMGCIRHPYTRGLIAREGIEY
ncbi:cob(I)yrinic acid a,c-diamide adenosyltransferase [Lachnospiraceae bacterium]|nr:cob(I)yrinic acid a,c-diamide adenosyltransferase [Lachnospiraceae bacterium]